MAGHRGDELVARRLRVDADGGVRATALAALARMGSVTIVDLMEGLADPSASVRQRAAELAATVTGPVDLVPVLADVDVLVVEAACWALGERADPGPAGEVVDALAAVATTHADPLCREAAVAALGAVGDERGLAAILQATKDKPAVRRRAVLALAPFEGPEIDAALHHALSDRDWQVRQAAEDLL